MQAARVRKVLTQAFSSLTVEQKKSLADHCEKKTSILCGELADKWQQGFAG